MKSFHWNITKMEQEDMIKIYRVGMFTPGEFASQFDEEVEKIKEMVDDMGAKRLVIDSTTAFGMWMENEQEIRYSLFKLVNETKNLNCTALLTAETMGGRDEYSRFGVEEFVVDGVMALYFIPPQRVLFVKKMRGTNHDKKPHPFEITQNGIKIDPREQVLWTSLNK
jgi:KaiC/GvpD/RAD55 family RecA-like ATPase